MCKSQGFCLCTSSIVTFHSECTQRKIAPVLKCIGETWKRANLNEKMCKGKKFAREKKKKKKNADNGSVKKMAVTFKLNLLSLGTSHLQKKMLATVLGIYPRTLTVVKISDHFVTSSASEGRCSV